ncbi:MAG: L-2-amino-thiazoline-4-carboxylic acid hydrolase [Candidatus Aminicenantes bacterium]|nr:L-2-amino-thiazoline-4-carboxylic acid hydrolase [Candidatus Aminicenantes bacterium]
MKKTHTFQPGRREFISKLVPACSFLCFGARAFSPLRASGNSVPSLQEKHIFDQDLTFGREMTFKEYYRWRFNNKFIPILQEIADEMGREKFLDILKKASYEANRKLGESLSKRVPRNNISFFAGAFLNPGVDFQHSMIYEIIENTEQAFEVKITECLTEVTFREANSLDIGFAGVCHADYGFPEGLNPKIKMVRDKTLMQGHDCCNHRYVWKS